MKNREYRALLTLILMASLVAGSVRTTPADVYAKENTAVTAETVNYQKDTAEPDRASSAAARKEETVYAKVDGDGTIISVTVSDQLKNVKGIKKIQDVSDLKEIENVKGDENYSQSGESLVWKGDDKDICYQGTGSKALPVGIKVTYQLNGQEISAGDLKGKSGHLAIHYEYENMTEQSDGEYTPFLMLTGLMLDTDKFTNVTISSGKIISDGDRDVAVGMGVPKMKEALGVSDLDLPDSFDLEADVTDYDAIEGITIATNDIFNQLGLDKFDSMEDLKDSMGELADASNRLVSGSGELKEGLDTLLSSSGTLIDGIDKLADGSATLKNGTGTLAKGAGTLAKGSSDLASGTGQLKAGTQDLASGAKQVADGAAAVSGKVSGELLSGVQALNSGADGMAKELKDGTTALADGVSSLKQGVDRAATAASELDAGVDSAKKGTEALKAGADTAAGQLDTAAAALNHIAGTLSGQPGYQVVTLSDTVAVDNSNEIESLRSIENGENSAVIEQVIESLAGKTASVSEEVEVAADQGDGQAAAAIQQVAQGLQGLGSELKTGGVLGDGIDSLSHTLGSTEGVTIKAGSAGLNAGLNNPDPAHGMKAGVDVLYDNMHGDNGLVNKVNSGVGQLQAGTGSLLAGTQALLEGLDTLSKGASDVASGSGTLNNKMDEADQGAKSAASGASKLSSGATELNFGAGTLVSGAGALKTGSGALTDGVQQLDDGAGELNGGMIQFNEEGIQKLVNAFDGDISGLLDKLNEMMDASKAYKNFSGISKEMDGEVKFIFVTEAD